MKQYNAFCESNIGKNRINNEDNFFCAGFFRKDVSIDNFSCDYSFNEQNRSVIAVFDGMGGACCGEKASYFAAEALDDYLHEIEKNKLPFDCETATRKMNKKVCAAANEMNVKMGSTVVLLLYENNYVRILNVGDSKAYLFRSGALQQVSTDHTEESIFRQIQMNLGKSLNASTSAFHNVLTQHLGIDEEEFVLEPAVTEKIPVCENDIFLLCSDGLTNMLNDDIIKEIICANISDKQKVFFLIENALKKGGKDNITVSLVCF